MISKLNSYGAPLLLALCTVLACNRNSNQLPVVKVPSKKMTVDGISNGQKMVEFTFKQDFAAAEDTIWLSVTNTTEQNLQDFRFFVEMCSSLPKNYDNCYDQKQDILASLPAHATHEKVIYWIKKDFIDSSLINTGILSYKNSLNDLGSLYSSVYAAFSDTTHTVKNDSVTITSVSTKFGQVNGFILADGSATFRIKKADGDFYNLEGLFLKEFGFNGSATHNEQSSIEFVPDSIQKDSTQLLYDATSGFLRFKVRLKQTESEPIKTILVHTKRN